MRTMTLEQLEDRIERKKAELGFSGDGYVLPNSGINRSADKQALLEALESNAAAQGRTPAFGARK